MCSDADFQVRACVSNRECQRVLSEVGMGKQGRRLKENVNTGLVALHIEIRKSKILGITKKRTTTTKVSLMPSNIKVSYPTLCKNFGVEILIPSTSGHGLFGNRWLYSYKYNKTQ